ncbi:MAG: hypothetical protein IKY37_06180 [Bacteroidaceae bacterium]|nr:hypothetical protein [Bacteroidaceae bacterium]
MNRYIEIESYDALQALIAPGAVLEHYAFQNIEFGRNAVQCRFKDCIFMGCTMPDVMRGELSSDCCVLPKLPVPFNPFPAHLYSPAELYAGYDFRNPDTFGHCYDTRIYNHYIDNGKQATNIAETLARSLHDHSISDALHDMLSLYDERKVVAIMGGHALLRTDDNYRKVVLIGKHLAEKGCLMVTGGGPGAMEAAHLGVWLAGRHDSDVDNAIALLSGSPSYKDKEWLSSAFDLMEKMPRVTECSSIGIPTWFYGHEPATPFATHIAKYFDNSIREDGLLAIAKGGVVYSPGSAGTMQEVFQDAAQNHYLTCGYASPMVFLGREYWNEKFPVYPMLNELQCKGCYKNLLLSITDSPADAVNAIMAFSSQCQKD